MRINPNTVWICLALSLGVASLAQSSTNDPDWKGELVTLRHKVDSLQKRIDVLELRVDKQAEPIYIDRRGEPSNGPMRAIYPTLPPKSRDGKIINGFEYDFLPMEQPPQKARDMRAK